LSKPSLHKEAESLFTQAETSPANSISEPEMQENPQASGRILPCLLQEVRSPTSENLVKVSNARTNMGRSSSPVRKKQGSNRSSKIDVYTPTLWRPSVSDEFSALSDLEVLSLIERAKIELARRKDVGKEQLRAEIEAKLKDAGLDLGDLFTLEGKRGVRKLNPNDGAGVAPKYRNHASGETWSGRGRTPKWVAAIMHEREWTVEQFKQSDEFLIP
jgi:DNA-binding protein H-NS